MKKRGKIFRLTVFGLLLLNIITAMGIQGDSSLEILGMKIARIRGDSKYEGPAVSHVRSIPRLMRFSTNSSSTSLQDHSGSSIPNMNIMGGYSLPSWGGLGYEYRKNFTVNSNKVAADLTNFPVLINLEGDTDLLNVRQTSGNDILFTDDSGTKLDFQIELFDQNEPSFVAWVKTNLSSTTNTIISMYYGNSTAANQENPSGVWDSNYVGVWHMNEDPSGTAPQIIDSTSPSSHGTTSGAMTSSDQMEGIISGSVDLDGTNDYVDFGNPSELQITGAFTLEVNFLADDVQNDYLINKMGAGGSRGWDINLDDDFPNAPDGWMFFQISPDGTNMKSVGYERIIVGQWYHVVGVYSPSTYLRFYVNGQLAAEDTASIPSSMYDPNLPVRLGFRSDSSSSLFDGSYDEVRISTTARPAEWISAEYQNFYNSSHFYSVGHQEALANTFFKYQKILTINSSLVSGNNDLTNFPFLLDLYNTDLNDSENVWPNASNLVFINLKTKRKLFYEIELFDQYYNSTHAHLVAWIQLDTLSVAEDTQIGIYYGNQVDSGMNRAKYVWSEYLGVWHMSDPVLNGSLSSKVHIDSTPNNNHGNQNGNNITSRGQIGDAQDFDGIDDFIDVADTDSLDLIGDTYYTISGWFYRDSTSTVDVILDKFYPESPEYTGYSLWIDNSDGLLHFIVTDDDDDGVHYKSTSNFNSLPNDWYYFSINFDTGINSVPFEWSMFINGINDSAVYSIYGADDLAPESFSTSKNLANLTFGASANNSNFFDGKIDEIRLISKTLSPDWIQTEYTNQKDPNSFYSVSVTVNNPNWWKNDSFSRRKDLFVNSTLITGEEENFILRPKAIGLYSDFYATGGASAPNYKAVLDKESDGDYSYIYQDLNHNSSTWQNGYDLYYDPSVQDLSKDINITRVSLFSIARRTGPLINARLRNYIRVIGTTGYTLTTRTDHAIGGGYALYGDEWIINPRTNEPWLWEDLQNCEFGVRGWITMDSSQTSYELRVSQVYLVVSYTRIKPMRNFPLMVDIYDSDLKSNIQADASDMAFYDETGRKLHHEIVDFDQSYGPSLAHLTAWVTVPWISPTLNALTMYYGNSSLSNQESKKETWSKEYLAVYHMEETPPGNILDSNDNALHLTPSGSMDSSDLVAGQISNAIDFDGSNDQLYTTQSISLQDFTVSAWFKYDSGTAWHTIVNIDRAGTDFYHFGIYNDEPQFDDTGPTRWFTYTMSSSTWYHITYTYDSNSRMLKCYLNGVKIGTTYFITISPITDDFQVGAWNTFNEFDGIIDEVRLLNTTKSVAWIEAEYENQQNPASFVLVGSENQRKPGISNLALNPAVLWSNTSLTLTYDFYDPGGVPENGTEIRWYNNSAIQPSFNDTKTIPSTALNRGDQWYATVRPKSGGLFGEMVNSSTITVVNTPPNVQSVILNPVLAYTTSTITIANVTSDYEGDTITNYHIEWYRNSIYDSSYDNYNLLLPANISKGETWYCRVRAYDGADNSSWASSGIVTIENSIPQAINLGVTPDPLYTNDTLTANWAISDLDNDPQVSFTISWYKFGVNQTSLFNSTNVKPGNTTKGDVWSFKVRIFDGENYSTLTSLPSSVQILNSPPSITVMDLTSNLNTTAEDLVASWAVDDNDIEDLPSMLFNITWYLNGMKNRSSITSLYTATLSYIFTKKSDNWTYVLRAYDGTDYSKTLSLGYNVTILNTPPEVSTLSLTSDPVTTQNLQASWNFLDDDNDGLIFNVSWYLNGILNSTDATSLNYIILESGNTSKYQNWTFAVTAYDNEAYSPTLSLGYNVTVQNSIPLISSNGFNETSPVGPTKDFNITYAYLDADGDGEDTNALIVYWFTNYAYNASFQNKTTIYSTNTTAGQVWYYTIRVFDGETYSQNYSSLLMIIGARSNTAPLALYLNVTPSIPLTSDILTVNYTYFDSDNDPQFLHEIIWFRNNVSMDQFNNMQSLPTIATSEGDEWNFTIRVHDGITWGPISVSPTYMIVNSPPVINGGSLTITAAPYTNDDVYISWSANDADVLDILTFNITWYLNGGKFLSKNYTTFSSYLGFGNTTKGQNWTFSVLAYDEAVSSSTVSLGFNITILNSLPKAENLTLTQNPSTTDDLIPGWDFSDKDNDGRNDSSTRISWFKNGGNQTNLFNKPYLEWGNTSKDQVWWFKIQVYDGEDYSIVYESVHVQILNSLPYNNSKLPLPVDPSKRNGIQMVLGDLISSFTDNDSDTITISEIVWYKDGVLQGNLNGTLTVSGTRVVKGEVWNYAVIPSDGEGIGNAVNSTKFVIRNSPPTASGVVLKALPDGNTSYAFTLQDLNATWLFQDLDGDPASFGDFLIFWYRKPIGSLFFQLQGSLTGLTTVPWTDIRKFDTWYFNLTVSDGYDRSLVSYQSNSIFILNSPIQITRLWFENSSGSEITNLLIFSNEYFTLEWDFYDADADPSLATIHWYKNNVFQPQLNDSKSITQVYLTKGDQWYAKVWLYDGTDTSKSLTSPIMNVVNTPPMITSVSYMFDLNSQVNLPRINEFYVEDEDIVISYLGGFMDIDGDSDSSTIKWFKQLLNGTWVELLVYRNNLSLPHTITSPGEIYYCMITPNDGDDSGLPINSSLIVIESRPVIEYFEITASSSSEGIYELTVSATDELNAIYEVEFLIVYNDNSSKRFLGRYTTGANWTLSHSLENLIYLDTVVYVTVTASTLIQGNFVVSVQTEFSFIATDKAPPRVLDSFFNLNDENNPTNITFYVYAEEFGSGISDITLFYFYSAVNESNGGQGAGYQQSEPEWNMVLMNFHSENSTGNFSVYSVTVDFQLDQDAYDVIYMIATRDNDGNTNPQAFDIRNYPQRISEQRIFRRVSEGIPEWILWIAGLIVFVIFVGAVVYVKYIQKPAGLDKELVIKRIAKNKVSYREVMNSLDSHTIGIVISFFDQRHGPIPIIVFPEILKDNFQGLVELSDRSFSGTGFTSNHSIELPSSYEFQLGHEFPLNVISFSFSLENPEARGGQENLTFNILIQREVFPLLNQFVDEIRDKVHTTHMLMATDSQAKKEILESVFEVRKFASYVVLAYEQIYGTIELLTEGEE